MKRLKKIEVFQARDGRYLRLWQYAGRGGQALVKQIRLSDGEKPSMAYNRPEVVDLLKKEFAPASE